MNGDSTDQPSAPAAAGDPSGTEQPASLLRTLRRIGGSLQRLPRRWAWIPVVGWMGLIWFGSSLEGRISSSAPSTMTFFGNLFHSVEFGCLALIWHLLAPRSDGWPRLDRRWALFIFMAVITYAGVDEFHQSFVPGRDMSLWDFGTDASGAACVLWIVAYVGSAEARTAGLRGRLLAGSLLCMLSALSATGPLTVSELLFG